MINILISVNRKYLDKAKTMLHSLRRNHSEDITVYLINRSLCIPEINKFRKYLKKHLRMDFIVIDISSTAFEQLPLDTKKFSIEIYYRVIAQFLLPQTVERIIWLDADIVFCGNISEFYYQDFEGALLAVCPDANCEDKDIIIIKESLGLSNEHIYFNSGVLLLNIEALRKTTTLDEIVQSAQSIAQYLVYPDQDLLNYFYSGRVKYCNQNQYNCQVTAVVSLTQDQISDIVILHYAGSHKPWIFYYLHDLSRAAIPYWREVALRGKWLSIVKIGVLYALWLVYYKTGICNIVRKIMLK